LEVRGDSRFQIIHETELDRAGSGLGRRRKKEQDRDKPGQEINSARGESEPG
jgi:hypothetical protein